MSSQTKSFKKSGNQSPCLALSKKRINLKKKLAGLLAVFLEDTFGTHFSIFMAQTGGGIKKSSAVVAQPDWKHLRRVWPLT